MPVLFLTFANSHSCTLFDNYVLVFALEIIQDNYTYGRAASVGSYENKQYYQTSIAPAQRTPTDTYFQPGDYNTFIAFIFMCHTVLLTWIRREIIIRFCLGRY